MLTENDGVLFAMCDVDKEEELSGRANIRSLPTFLFLLDGCELGRIEGSNNMDGVYKMTAGLVDRVKKKRAVDKKAKAAESKKATEASFACRYERFPQ